MARIIKLVCVNDVHVREFPDTGNDRNGDPTSNRQALMRVLDKRVEVDGRSVKAFLLAEMPSVRFSGDEDFDQRVLMDGRGDWLIPDEAWLKVRAARCEARALRASGHEQQAQAAQAQQVTGAMVDLARSLTAQPARSMPASAKPKAGAQ